MKAVAGRLQALESKEVDEARDKLSYAQTTSKHSGHFTPYIHLGKFYDMKSSDPQTSKKRKTPKFQHLPVVQAAKAKRAWVEKVKLRSQWSKQKRKVPMDIKNKPDNDDEASPTLTAEAQEDEDEEEFNDLTKNQQDMNERRASKPLPATKPRQATSGRVPERQHKEARSETEAQDTQRLRDLTRRAYSRESLHTFKSDPLNRQRGHRKEGGRSGTTGKGQPNMKLRMNALLEKIKMDVGKQ